MDRPDRKLKLKDEIRHRLQAICSNFSRKDFEVLVEQIADNSLKGELRPFRPTSSVRGDRPAK